MSESKWTVDLKEICDSYEEDWYPRFALVDGFQNKGNYRFIIVPSTTADALAWGELCEEHGAKVEASKVEGDIPVGVFITVDVAAKFWLLRRIVRPCSDGLKQVWNWKPSEGQVLGDKHDPMTKLPRQMIHELFEAAQVKFQGNVRMLPEDAPPDAETVTPKS